MCCAVSRHTAGVATPHHASEDSSCTGCFVLELKSQYNTGSTDTTSTIEIHVPKQITTPIGDHNALLLMIIGTTPIEAAALVRKIGRVRRLPASKAASRADKPPLRRKVSA